MKNQTTQTATISFEELRALIAETGRQMKETDKRWEETRQEIKELNKKYGGISQSNGEVAEEYFYNSFSKHPYFAGHEFDSLTPRLSKKIKKLKLEGEFDLVLYNCTSVVIVEIKYKARKIHIENLLKKPEIFKLLFPEYANFQFYLALAGLTVEKEVETVAEEQGIAIIKQVGDNMVIFDKHLKVF